MSEKLLITFSPPEHLPKSFQSPLAKERDMIGVTADAFAEMMEGSEVAPFK